MTTQPFRNSSRPFTAALFLLAGSRFERTKDYALDAYGGLAATAPRYATLFTVAAFGSLGPPALSGFIAEFQILAGSIATVPITAVAVVGILITAALFLRALQRLFTGPTAGHSVGFADVTPREWGPVALLLAASVFIGVLPRPLLDLIEPAAAVLADLVGR